MKSMNFWVDITISTHYCLSTPHPKEYTPQSYIIEFIPSLLILPWYHVNLSNFHPHKPRTTSLAKNKKMFLPFLLFFFFSFFFDSLSFFHNIGLATAQQHSTICRVNSTHSTLDNNLSTFYAHHDKIAVLIIAHHASSIGVWYNQSCIIPSTALACAIHPFKPTTTTVATFFKQKNKRKKSNNQLNHVSLDKHLFNHFITPQHNQYTS